MGNQANGPDSPEFGEIQALMCNEVLRDWLRHLENEADAYRRPQADDERPRHHEHIG